MKNAVYFFAQYPRDYAMCAGLADILREFRPNLPLILICTTEPNTQGYQWDDVLGRFDQVHHVSSVMHGGFRSAFNLRGIASALIKDFPRARKVVAELRKIEFLSNSIAFVFDGYSLNQSIFLKRVGSDPETVYDNYRAFLRWVDDTLDPAAQKRGVSSCEMCHRHLDQLAPATDLVVEPSTG